MTQALKPVIVGAGPAGIRAAQTLVAHGLRPIVIDESARWGGQIYRQTPGNFTRSSTQLYGFDARKADSVLSVMASLLSKVDYRPNTLVWNAEGGQLDVLHEGHTSVLEYTDLIVATGATDRILPFKGWTLPGVFSMGGAQVALKFQGCAIGQKVVFAGSGPLLYLVAYQYAKAGANVVAVIDSSHFSCQIKAVPALLNQPAVLAKGVYYLAWLKAHGIAIHHGATPIEVMGAQSVEQLIWRNSQGAHQIDCDAVATGYGLRSESQLADILGCKFVFSKADNSWIPQKDVAGRSTIQHVYLAGDGAGIQGADAAEWAGELAGLALIEDRQQKQQTNHAIRSAELAKFLQKRVAFGRGLSIAFQDPQNWASKTTDDTVICRCEEITAGDIRQSAHATAAQDVNRLKAMCRVGMGRCQGRMCGPAAAALLADCTHQSIEKVGRLRGQAPIKPIPFVQSPALKNMSSDTKEAT
jgi:NADPH-dependent 2,4-dienoyl-CoA reductase/sulfur reductase-like enzyme